MNNRIELGWQRQVLPQIDSLIQTPLTDTELNRLIRYTELGSSFYQATAQQPFIDIDKISQLIDQTPNIEGADTLKKLIGVWYPFVPFLTSIFELKHKHERSNAVGRMWSNFDMRTDYQLVHKLHAVCEDYTNRLKQPGGYFRIAHFEAQNLHAAKVFLPSQLNDYPVIVPDLMQMGVRRLESVYKQLVGLGQTNIMPE